jgi:hypothetical protein
MTARDLRYGRRGGGWLPARQPAPVPVQRTDPAVLLARDLAKDPARWFHPERWASLAAHRTHSAGTCAYACDRDLPCDCPPGPGVLAELWAGLARMVTARRAADRTLNDLDHQALDRLTDPGADTR